MTSATSASNVEKSSARQVHDTTNAWRYLWDNQRKTVEFTIIPKNEATGPTNPTVSGLCVCVPGELGGKAEDAAAFTCSLPIIGEPTLDFGTLMAASSSNVERETVDA